MFSLFWKNKTKKKKKNKQKKKTSWVSFSGGYGTTRGCVFVVLSKFKVMKRSEKEKQSYKLGHNRKKNKKKQQKLLALRIYQLEINDMYTAILGFVMSIGIEVNILILIIHKNF